jgi:predicted glycosyltransferase
MIRKVAEELSKHAKVFISSEGELPGDMKQYQIKIPPEKMHDALAFAILFVGEGATMASECAMLGTPAIYINSLEVGYCTEEEKKYNLVYNFRNSEGVIAKAFELLKTLNMKQEWQQHRQKMLSEKIDVTAFMVWFVENYPDSVNIMKENPDYRLRFK